MKRFLASALLLFLLVGLGHAAYFQGQTYLPNVTPNPNLRQDNFFGINEAAWQSFTGNYTPGLGNPAVSTDDYYHQNGLSGMRPYDLLDPSFTGACATAGAVIAGTAGKGRYFWPLFPDHGDGGSAVWNNSFSFRFGYSNDPGVLPSAMAAISLSSLATSNPAISTITASISNGSGGPGNTLNVTAYTGLIPYSSSRATVSGAGVTTANITAGPSNGQTGNYTISGAAQLVASQTMTVSANGSYSLYYDPTLICNPDDATTPFWLYAEGNWSNTQHVMGVIKSADLDTWTTAIPTHNPLDFNTWSSFQRINRISTGNWVSKGFEVGYPQNGNVFARSTWTSTDGLVWTPGASNLNQCIPASSQVGTTTSCSGTSKSFLAYQSPYVVTIAGTPWVLGQINSYVSGTRIGSQWAGRVAVDSNQSVIDTPAAVNISDAYGGVYPGPSYLQTVTGYVEDGIAHYYGVKGWPISNGIWFQAYLATYSNNGGCAANPTVNGQQGYFQFTGSSSTTTLTVQSLGTGTIQIGSIIYGNGIANNANVRIVNQINGTPNGVGDYTITPSTTVSLGTITGSSCGGLWQQSLDYFTEIVDVTAAAGAAPVGVRASCAGSTATINWYTGVTPTDTMRLYRGTTAGSQTTLVGDFSGGTATDTGMSLNVVTYYKLVYLNGGVEQKNRVVNTYCSSSIYSEVNAHITRALAAGADSTTCNRTFMDTYYGWLTSNSRKNNLLFATMPDFCVTQNGSNQISKIFDMGTTRLPRGGDYTPTTPASTTYSATGINSKPAWVNGINTAQGYYGGGLLNNIRRKTQITLFAAYQKPNTFKFTPLAWGENGGMQLSHTAGSPGTISCTLYDATHPVTATASITGLATDVHTGACTFDGTNLTAYSDGVAGTPQAGLIIPSPNLSPPDALTGQIGVSSTVTFLGSGSASSKYVGGYVFSNNEAQSSVRANMIYDIALPGSEVASLDALVR